MPYKVRNPYRDGFLKIICKGLTIYSLVLRRRAQNTTPAAIAATAVPPATAVISTPVLGEVEPLSAPVAPVAVESSTTKEKTESLSIVMVKVPSAATVRPFCSPKVPSECSI